MTNKIAVFIEAFFNSHLRTIILWCLIFFYTFVKNVIAKKIQCYNKKIQWIL